MAGLTNDEANHALELAKQVSMNFMMPSVDGFPKAGGLGDVTEGLPLAIMRMALRHDVPWHMEAAVPIRDKAHYAKYNYEPTDKKLIINYTDPQTDKPQSTSLTVYKRSISVNDKEVTLYGLPFDAYRANVNYMLLNEENRKTMKGVIERAGDDDEIAAFKEKLKGIGLDVGAIEDNVDPDMTIIPVEEAGKLSTLGSGGSGKKQSKVAGGDKPEDGMTPDDLLRSIKNYTDQYEEAVNYTVMSKAFYALGMIRSGDDVSNLETTYGVKVENNPGGVELKAYDHPSGKPGVNVYVVNDWHPQIGIDVARHYISKTLNDKLIVAFNHNIDVGRPWQGDSLDIMRKAMTVESNKTLDSVPDEQMHPMEKALWQPESFEKDTNPGYWPSITLNNKHSADGSIINSAYASYFLKRPDTPQHQTALDQYNNNALNHNHHGVEDDWFANNSANTALEGNESDWPGLIDASGSIHNRLKGLGEGISYQRLQTTLLACSR